MKMRNCAAAAAAALLIAAGCGDDTNPSGGSDAQGDTGATTDVGGIGGDDVADAAGDASTDTGTEDTGTPDAATDTGSDVGAPDTGPTDVAVDTGGPEDVSTDTGSDAEDVLPPPAEDQAFRVNKLVLLAPEMCIDLDGDGTCDPVNIFVNAIIDGELTAEEEPLDVMGVISPFEVPTSTATLTLGEADCVRPPGGGAQDVTSCTFPADPTATGAVFEQVLTKDVGGCSANPVILAPCFATSNQQTLSLTLLEIPFTFLQAKVAGKFLNPGSFNGITDGYIRGFMPVTTAAGVQVDVPGQGYVKLSDLLKQAPKTTVDDKNGWVFEFSFEADRIDIGE
ncbi:MAG: hypothetical protein AMXMBFR64_14840 [Myxococcales bacterium]